MINKRPPTLRLSRPLHCKGSLTSLHHVEGQLCLSLSFLVSVPHSPDCSWVSSQPGCYNSTPNHSHTLTLLFTSTSKMPSWLKVWSLVKNTMLVMVIKNETHLNEVESFQKSEAVCLLPDKCCRPIMRGRAPEKNTVGKVSLIFVTFC